MKKSQTLLLLEALDRYGWQLGQGSEYPNGKRRAFWTVRFPNRPGVVIKGRKLVGALQTALCQQSVLSEKAGE